jgi:hypothetical protein
MPTVAVLTISQAPRPDRLGYAGLRLREDPACGEGKPLQAFPCALRCLGNLHGQDISANVY